MHEFNSSIQPNAFPLLLTATIKKSNPIIIRSLHMYENNYQTLYVIIMWEVYQERGGEGGTLLHDMTGSFDSGQLL